MFLPEQFPLGTYAGTMTLSLTPPVDSSECACAPTDVLTLTYYGRNDDGGDFYGFQPFSGKLTVESGVGKFQGARDRRLYRAIGTVPRWRRIWGDA